MAPAGPHARTSFVGRSAGRRPSDPSPSMLVNVEVGRVWKGAPPRAQTDRQTEKRTAND